MKRPFADKRPIGPFTQQSTDKTLKINVTVDDRKSLPQTRVKDFEPSDLTVQRKIGGAFEDAKLPISNPTVETVMGNIIQISTKRVLVRDDIIEAMDVSEDAVVDMGMSVQEISVSCDQ
jgi:hypothetical protein